MIIQVCHFHPNYNPVCLLFVKSGLEKHVYTVLIKPPLCLQILYSFLYLISAFSRHICCRSGLNPSLLSLWSGRWRSPGGPGVSVNPRPPGAATSPGLPGSVFPAIQDDTLKVKAVTARLPVPLGHAHYASVSDGKST